MAPQFHDRFASQLPTEFNESAHKLWIQSQKIAASVGIDRVNPWDYFIAWVESIEKIPMGITADEWLRLLSNHIRFGPPLEQWCDSIATPRIVRAFTYAIADSYRFTGVIADVDHRWIIPNLFDADGFLVYMAVQNGFDMRDTLTEVLACLGDEFPSLYGYYSYALWQTLRRWDRRLNDVSGAKLEK